MKKVFKSLFIGTAAIVAGMAEVFATVMLALSLTSTGSVEERISSAIVAMAEPLQGLELHGLLEPLAPAAHELGNWMGHMPQWALVTLALWGLYRALCATHGHGLGQKAWEAIREATTAEKTVAGKVEKAVNSENIETTSEKLGKASSSPDLAPVLASVTDLGKGLARTARQ